ncbi:hypothetical protein SAMN05421681_1052 [Lysobacter enzymogenes]|nr:hypothetical protein SAMN05421681_1052 [Lysobacter enzymogenes]
MIERSRNVKNHRHFASPAAGAVAGGAPHPDIVALQAAENEGWPSETAASSPPLFAATPWHWYFRAEELIAGVAIFPVSQARNPRPIGSA